MNDAINEQQRLKKGNVASVAATHFLHDTFSSFFAPLIPLLIEKLGFSFAMAGLLSTVQKLPSLCNPLIGIIADKKPIRSGIVVTPIVTIICMSLMGIAPSVTMLALLLFVCGISAAIIHVTAPVLMRRVSGERVGTGMSCFMFGGEIARTAGPLLITAAVGWWGLEGTWRLIPFGLVASLILFLNLRTIDKKALAHFDKKEKKNIKTHLRETLPFFALITPIILFRGFSNTALTLFLPTYLVEKGSTVSTAAFALAFLELAGACGALLAGSLSDKLGRKKILLGIMLMSPILMFLFTCSSGIAQWVLLGFMGLIFFGSTPVFMAMIHDLNSDRPSFTNGLYMTLSFAASSIVALLVGVLADHFGFVITYQITAGLSLVALPLTCLIKE